MYDTSGKEGAFQARGNAEIDPVEQTIILCKALFGSGKFDTVFGDPTTFPMFVMAIKMMEVCRWWRFLLDLRAMCCACQSRLVAHTYTFVNNCTRSGHKLRAGSWTPQLK